MSNIAEIEFDGAGLSETWTGRLFGPLYDWSPHDDWRPHVHTVMMRTADKKEIPLIVRGEELRRRCKRGRDLTVSGERNKIDNWGLYAGTAIVVTDIR
jgi:hypothetical protein